MSMVTAREDLLALVKSIFDAEASAPDMVLWDNVKGDPPLAGSWARVSMKPVGSVKRGIGDGSGMFEDHGFVAVELYFEGGDGNLRAAQFRDAAVPYLRRTRTANGVTIRDVDYTFDGEDGPWYRSTMIINYKYEEVN